MVVVEPEQTVLPVKTNAAGKVFTVAVTAVLAAPAQPVVVFLDSA